VLDALPEPSVETPEPAIQAANPHATKTGNRRSFLFGAVVCILAGMAAILLGMQIYRVNGLESHISEQRFAFNDALGRIESRLVRISVHQEKALTDITARVEGLSAKLSREEKPAARTAAGRLPRPDQGEMRRENYKENPHPPAWQPGPQKTTSAVSEKVEKSRETPEKGLHRSVPEPKAQEAGDAVRGDAFEFYQAKEDDMLWWIADRFYGSGFYYPVILEHNPDLGIYNLGKKDRIAILKDIDKARQLYHEITEIEGGCLYWYYMVRPGDTLKSVRKRYCPSKDCIRTSPGLDPEEGLKPGKKIKIQLAGV